MNTYFNFFHFFFCKIEFFSSGKEAKSILIETPSGSSNIKDVNTIAVSFYCTMKIYTIYNWNLNEWTFRMKKKCQRYSDREEQRNRFNKFEFLITAYVIWSMCVFFSPTILCDFIPAVFLWFARVCIEPCNYTKN